MGLKSKLVLNEKSHESGLLQKVYDLEVGDVFKIVGDYEAVMHNIEVFTPSGFEFEVFPITPGTSLFTMYGPDHCVVVKKQKC